ncbi:MAG: DMT family transporter [Candidatus Eisenbacteria bacterium]
MPALVLLALLCHVLLASGTFILAKVALREFDPMALAQLRFVLAGAGLFGLLASRGGIRPERMRGSWGALALLGVIGTTLNQGLFLAGLRHSTPAHGALLYAATPIVVLSLALARRQERASARRALGVLLAFAGVTFLLLGRGLTFDPRWVGGDALIFLAVIAWAVYTTRGKELISRLGVVPVTAWATLFGTICFLPVGVPALIAQDWSRITPAGWWSLAYIGVATSIVSYLLWGWALAHIEASRVAVFTNLQPVATALLAWALLGEPLTLHFVGATLFVLGGVWLADRG